MDAAAAQPFPDSTPPNVAIWFAALVMVEVICTI
jgi:hypothetical protein